VQCAERIFKHYRNRRTIDGVAARCEARFGVYGPDESQRGLATPWPDSNIGAHYSFLDNLLLNKGCKRIFFKVN
jgi:hypothetical protein